TKDSSLADELAALIGNRQDAALAAQALVRIAAKPAEVNAAKKSALLQISRNLRPDVAPAQTAEITAALEALLATGDGAVISATLPFAARWVKDGSLTKVLEPVTKSLLATVSDASKADDARTLALSSLLTFQSIRADAIAAGAALLQPSLSADLQRGVIVTLGETSDTAAAGALVAAYPRLSSALREL